MSPLVSAASMRAAYEFLRAASFHGAPLPPAERVRFVASRRLKSHGYHEYRRGRHTIWCDASAATRHGSLLLQIVAHEMCHAALVRHDRAAGSDGHDDQFRALARSVEHDMGWPKGSV